MLALYLYLDQYEMHHTQHEKQAEVRLETARRLTWLAVLGEKFHKVNLWFFHQFMLFLRWCFIGNEKNKEVTQEKQAVWLKENLIEFGPTFIKIGQSLGTRADLLPLPFVKALGELQDSVPPFSNEIAFARIEKELGKKINEVYAEFDIEPDCRRVFRTGLSRKTLYGRRSCGQSSASESRGNHQRRHRNFAKSREICRKISFA